MPELYKTSQQAGTEARRTGQGISAGAYKPGDFFRPEYRQHLNDLASKYMDTDAGIPAAPARRSGISAPPSASLPAMTADDYVKALADADATAAPASPVTQAPADATYLGDIGRSVERGALNMVNGVYELAKIPVNLGARGAGYIGEAITGEQAPPEIMSDFAGNMERIVGGKTVSEKVAEVNKGIEAQDTAATQAERKELHDSKGFWNGFTTVLTNPRLAGSMAFEMVPQLATVTVAARTAAARVFGMTLEAELAGGATEAAAAATANQAATTAATRTVMGLNAATEGGSAGADVRQNIMTMSEDELSKSPQYQKLVSQYGNSPDARMQARMRLANDASMFAVAIAAPISALSGKLTGAAGLEAKAVAGKAAGEVASTTASRTAGQVAGGFAKAGAQEFVQEGLEEGGSQFGQNVGSLLSGAKPNQDLMEGVPEAAGAGSALGVLAGGAFHGVNEVRGGRSNETQSAPANEKGNTAGSTEAKKSNNSGMDLTDEEFAGFTNSQPYMAAAYARADEAGRAALRAANPNLDYDALIKDNSLIKHGDSLINNNPAMYAAFSSRVAQVNQNGEPHIATEFDENGHPIFEGPNSQPFMGNPPPSNWSEMDRIEQRRYLQQLQDDHNQFISQEEDRKGGSETDTQSIADPNIPPQDVLIRGYQRRAENLMRMPEGARRAAATSSMEEMIGRGFTPEEAHSVFGRILNPDTSTDTNTPPPGESFDFTSARDQLAQRWQQREPGVKATDFMEAPVSPQLQAIADAFGVKLFGFRYIGSSKAVGKLNGISLGSSGAVMINTKKSSQLAILGHEIYHQLAKRDPAAAAQLQDAIKSYLKSKNAAHLSEKLKEIGYDPSKVDEEITADLMGIMFTDAQFWQQLGQKEPGLVQKILAIIDDMLKQFSTLGDRKKLVASAVEDLNSIRNLLVQFAQDTAAKKAQSNGVDESLEYSDQANLGFVTPEDEAVMRQNKRMANAPGSEKVDVPSNQFDERQQQMSFASAADEVRINEFDRRYEAANKQEPVKEERAKASQYVSAAEDDLLRVAMESSSQARQEYIAIATAFQEGKPNKATALFNASSLKVDHHITLPYLKLRSAMQPPGMKPYLPPQRSGTVDGKKVITPNSQEKIEEMRAESERRKQERMKRPVTSADAAVDAYYNGIARKLDVRTEQQPGRVYDVMTNGKLIGSIYENDPIVIKGKEQPQPRFAFVTVGNPDKKVGSVVKAFKTLDEAKAAIPKDAQIKPVDWGRSGTQTQTNLPLQGDKNVINRYKARIQQLMTTEFSPSGVADMLRILRRSLDNKTGAIPYNKPRSQAEYVFDQFADVGAIPDEGGTKETRVEINKSTGDREEKVVGNAKEVNRKEIERLNRAIEAVQRGDTVARAALLKANAMRVMESLGDLRDEMSQAGIDEQTINELVSPSEESIGTVLFNDDVSKVENEYETVTGANADALSRSLARQANEDTKSLGGLDFSDAVKAANAAIEGIIESKESPLVALRRELGKADREFGFTHLRHAMALRGMDVSVLDAEVLSMPAARYGLDYFVKKYAPQMGHYAARDAWLRSYDDIQRIYKEQPEQMKSINDDLSDNEKRVIEYVSNQKKEFRNRRQEWVAIQDGEEFPLETPQEAFPHALFNRYRLKDLMDGNIPEKDKSALSALVGGNTGVLPKVWLDDVSHAMNARKDLITQIMTGLTAQEREAVRAYIKQSNAVMAQNIRTSNLRTYQEQLDNILGLDRVAYHKFQNLMVYSDLKAVPAILHQAEQLAAITNGSKNRKELNAALEAYLDKIYTEDETSSKPVDELEGEFAQIETEDTPHVTDEEIADYVARNPGTDSDTARTDLLSMKIAEEATRVANEEAIAADESVQPENQVGLSGDIRYKRGRHSPRAHGLNVAAHLASVVSDWETKPAYQVFQNPDQIPDPEVRKRLTSRLEGDKIKGAIDPETGIVYIFSQQVSSHEDAEFTLFHELYGHWGMRYFLGAKFDAFLENQYRLNKEVRQEADRQRQEALDNNETMGRLESVEEAISDMAANGKTRLFREIIGRMISWLRSKGMDTIADWMDSHGKSELAYVLSRARKAVRTQQGYSPINGAPDDVMYARRKNPVELYAERDGKMTAYSRMHPVTGRWTTFTIKDVDAGDYDVHSHEDMAQAYAAIKRMGKVTKSLARETMLDNKEAQDIKQIPSMENLTGMKKLWRNVYLGIAQQYLPVYEVARWMNDNGKSNTAEDDLVKYESRMLPFIRKFQKVYFDPAVQLLKDMGAKGATKEDIDEFLMARHAPERNDYIKAMNDKNEAGSGMSTVEANRLLKTSAEGRWEAFRPELDKLGTLLDQMSRDKLNYMLQTGLIDARTHKALSKYQHYVSLSGNENEPVDTNMKAAAHFTLKGSSFIRSTGRGTKAANVLENTLNGYLGNIILGQKNRVRQSILQMLEQNPDPGFVTIQPIKQKKTINVEAVIRDNKILRAIGGKGDERSGRDYLKKLKSDVDEGRSTVSEALDKLEAKIWRAADMRQIEPSEADAAVRRLDEPVILKGLLSEKGYVHQIEDNGIIHDPNVIVAKVKGKHVMMQFHQPASEFVNSVSGTNVQQQDGLTAFFGGWNRVFSQMVTSMNPAWIVPNMVRDFMSAYANIAADENVGPELAGKMRKEWGNSFRISWRYTIGENADPKAGFWGRKFSESATKKPLSQADRQIIEDFFEDGAGTFFLDKKGLEQTIETMNRHMNPQALTDIRSLEEARHWSAEKFDGVARLMDVLGSPGELASRLSIYKVLRDNGRSREEAARYAKEVTTDFNAKGNLKWLRGAYAFFQPTVNGTVRMFQNYSRSKEGVGRFLPNNQFAKVAGFFALAGAVSNLLARALGGHDDDKPGVDRLDMMSNHDRTTKMILVPDMYLGSIPLAYGWNVFFSAGHYATDVAIGKLGSMEAAGRVLKAAIDSYSPIGSGVESKTATGAAVKMVAPSFFVPLVEMGMNESSFGAPIYKSGANSDVKGTDAYNHFDSANPISKSIMHGLAKATSGGRNPRYTEALIDVSPASMDHLVGSYLPGLFNETYKGAGALVNMAQGRDMKESPIPILGRFRAHVNDDSYNSGAMRRVKEQVDTLAAELNNPETSSTRQKQILKEHPALLSTKVLVDSTDQRIKTGRRMLQQYEQDPAISDSRKVELRNETERLEKKYRRDAVRASLNSGFRDAILDNGVNPGAAEQLQAIINQGSR